MSTAPVEHTFPRTALARRTAALTLMQARTRIKAGRSALDDEQVRRVKLLLLGKESVSARRLERPFAAGMDDG
jgi:hypothetical protein